MMKKSLTLFLAALMLLQCTACNSSGGDETTAPASTEAAQTTAPEDEGITTPGIDALTDEDKAAYQALVAQNADRAAVVGGTIKEYYFSGRGDNVKLAMYYNMNTNSATDTASAWHYMAAMTMVSKLQAIDAGGKADEYKKFYEQLVDALEYYKGTAYITDYTGTHQFSLYAVNRASAKGKADISGIAAVYDDQMWFIREMVYAYKLTGNEEYLQIGLDLTEACLAGWDSTLNAKGEEYGGICWGPGYQTKHTCSNAPIIEPLVEIYEIFAEEGRENADYYLDWAKKIYKWTNRLNTGNGLYGDLLGSQRVTEGSGKGAKYVTTSQESSIDKTTWTYNTGAMISGGAALYRVTGEKAYLTQAKRSARAAHTVLGNLDYKEGCVLYPTNSSTCWFDLILLEGYIDLFPYDEGCKDYIDAIQNTLDYGYENYVDEKGFLPRNLLGGWTKTNPDVAQKNIMDQAANAEMFAILAEFYSSVTA